MINKPDMFVLSGKSGKTVMNKIHTAKPCSASQYTKKERDSFEAKFSEYIPAIIENWKKNSK